MFRVEADVLNLGIEDFNLCFKAHRELFYIIGESICAHSQEFCNVPKFKVCARLLSSHDRGGKISVWLEGSPPAVLATLVVKYVREDGSGTILFLTEQEEDLRDRNLFFDRLFGTLTKQ